ncbi:MAG: hypothetical protein AVDCRST_MAG59-255 [uncultured Thermomicrobiales bacterium]|jgi:hypothetical protein|uniref:Uncharacterized protein n=1 Tax=uncultured Thermomicrobiales bacterium TaxID=1645740 RepID=A0A6J4TY69_9BACT|nr:MAG: hypothetical protein AVDCRST_MAG59-255 [uncultured Thermomicrobiales bacterium]
MPSRPRRAPESAGPAGAASALAAAAPLLVTALLAAIGASGVLPLPETGLPIPTLVVVAVQIVGIVLARELDLDRWRRLWWMALAGTAMLLPSLALQAALSRTPFVSWSSGSAGALVWVTLGTLVLIGGMWVWTATVSTDQPERAALVWLPAALLVPAVLGSPGTDLGEPAGLLALAIAFALAGAAVLLGELSPPTALLPIAVVTFVAELALLLVLGRLPALATDQGRVVPALGVLLLLAAVATLVAAPLAALAARRFGDLVDEVTPVYRGRGPRDAGRR